VRSASRASLSPPTDSTFNGAIPSLFLIPDAPSESSYREDSGNQLGPGTLAKTRFMPQTVQFRWGLSPPCFLVLSFLLIISPETTEWSRIGMSSAEVFPQDAFPPRIRPCAVVSVAVLFWRESRAELGQRIPSLAVPFLWTLDLFS